MYRFKQTIVPLASLFSLAVTACASTLTVIPLAPWTTGLYQNEGRAITPDGRYVVGANYASTTADGVGFLYDVATAALIRPQAPHDPDYAPRFLTGVGYRTSGGQKQLILDGNYAGWQANWMTADGGATWGAARWDNTFLPAGGNWPVANSLGASTAADRFYTIIGNLPADINNQRVLYTCRGSNTWSSATPCGFRRDAFYIDNPDAGNMTGVAATGRAVGWYRDQWADAGRRHNYVVDYPPKGPVGYPQSYVNTWAFKGLDGTVVGEAWSVSADGTRIFGRSPTPADANWHGYKAIVTAATNSLQSVRQLPDFANTAGSTRLATPYGCSADGRYAVGMNYRGTEKAVLWDTGSTNSANWTVLDLTERAASEGILGNFTRLYRGYSVGTNSAGHPVVTGAGVYFDGQGTYVRGFVMTVSPLTPPRPQITSVTRSGPTSVTVNYTNTVVGTNYTLQYNTNLNTTNWFTATAKAAGGTSDSQTDASATGAQRFYRVHTVVP